MANERRTHTMMATVALKATVDPDPPAKSTPKIQVHVLRDMGFGVKAAVSYWIDNVDNFHALYFPFVHV